MNEKSSRQGQGSASLVKPEHWHTWYVGFGIGNNFPEWQKWFCKPEWSHCFCFAQVGPFTQVVNPGWDRLEIGLRDTSAEEYARQFKESGWTVIKVDLAPEKMKYKSIWIPNCVSVVKTVIGFNTGWLDYNPEKFAKALVRSGKAVVL